MGEQFLYEIYYRIDSSEYFETDSIIVKAYSVEELLDHIVSIERRNTIIEIKNLSVL